MIDKAAIFTGVCKRNALRREAGLPLLDVRRECAHEEALALAHEHTAFVDQFGDHRLLIREQVSAELRAQYGPDFGRTMGGRWAINHETNKRFHAWVEAVHGLAVPASASRNAVVYGPHATEGGQLPPPEGGGLKGRYQPIFELRD